MSKSRNAPSRAAKGRSSTSKPVGRSGVPQTQPTDCISTEAVAPIATLQSRQTKASVLRAMLAAPGGTSLARIMAETGWQAHTVRAALSGLRKAGAQLTRHRAGDDTIYAICAVGPNAPEGSDEVDGGCGEPDAACLTSDEGDPGADSTGEGTAASEAPE